MKRRFELNHQMGVEYKVEYELEQKIDEFMEARKHALYNVVAFDEVHGVNLVELLEKIGSTHDVFDVGFTALVELMKEGLLHIHLKQEMFSKVLPDYPLTKLELCVLILTVVGADYRDDSYDYLVGLNTYKWLTKGTYVAASACIDGKGNMLLGQRHFDNQMHRLSETVVTEFDDTDHDQGFITNYYDYISRRQAWFVAVINGQLLHPNIVNTRSDYHLFSEDIW